MDKLTILGIIVGLLTLHAIVTLLPRARYNRLIDYLVLRKLGIGRNKAWEITGMAEVGDRAVGVLTAILIVLGVMYLMSSYANAATLDSKVLAQKAYVKSLEGLLATCLRDDGKGVLKIGDEWFICSAYPIGKFE